MILVVGATGELGTAIVEKLVASGKKVRVFVRPASNYQHLLGENVEVAYGDLRDARSVDKACQDIETVISTANSVIPRGKYSFEEDEGLGYDNLVNASKTHGVKQFIFISVPVTPFDDEVPTLRYKRLNERRIQQSGIAYTIFQGSLFMELWLALIGSSIPLRDVKISSLRRPYWFSRLFFGAVGHLIENRGLALIPGDGKTRHSWIAMDDVATIMTNAVGHPQAQNAVFELGGPEALSWDEVVQIYSQVLGREIRPIYTPVAIFQINSKIFKPFSEAASNLMGLNWFAGSIDSIYDSSKLAPFLDKPFTRVEQFLSAKVGATLPPLHKELGVGQ